MCWLVCVLCVGQQNEKLHQAITLGCVLDALNFITAEHFNSPWLYNRFAHANQLSI